MKKPQKSKIIITNPIYFIASSIQGRQTYFSINVLIIMLIMLSTFSCGKVEETAEDAVEIEEDVASMHPGEDKDLQYESVSKFRMHMKFLDDVDDALAASIDKQNWHDIRKYAMELKNTSPVIYTGRHKEELPHDFVMLDTMFHLKALAVVEASQAREMVKLNIEYEKLRQTCDDCHEKYKDLD